MYKKQIIIAVSLVSALMLSACSETDAAQSYMVRYHAKNHGGNLFGAVEQTVEAGGEGKPVSVIAGDGFVFEGWDDGSGVLSTGAVHYAENVSGNMDITAVCSQKNSDIP